MAPVVPVLPPLTGEYVRDDWMPSRAVATWARPWARSRGERFWKDWTTDRLPLVTDTLGVPVLMSAQSACTVALTVGRGNEPWVDATMFKVAWSAPGVVSKPTVTIPAPPAAPPASSPGLVPPEPLGSAKGWNVPPANVPRATRPSPLGARSAI